MSNEIAVEERTEKLDAVMELLLEGTLRSPDGVRFTLLWLDDEWMLSRWNQRIGPTGRCHGVAARRLVALQEGQGRMILQLVYSSFLWHELCLIKERVQKLQQNDEGAARGQLR